MEVVDLPEPGPAEPGRVVVRPEAVGLCGFALQLRNLQFQGVVFTPKLLIFP